MSITDTTAHPAQGASILFCRHINSLLSTLGSIDIELAWIPGHHGIIGNERADSIAKDAVNKRPLFHSTISWAREKAKSRATKTWQTEWLARPHINLAATALSLAPSAKLTRFHQSFNGPRETHTRIMQILLGHSFCGEYYSRFVPSESVECPCGHPIQTRTHIITECPLLEPHRHHLRTASHPLSLPILLSTKTGLKALAKFISASHAFSKSASSTPAPESSDIDYG
jgi:hypothetical protein